MGLHKWIYQGKVKKHLVEVNHSPESGKLMIKLNGEMMLYDYGVFHSDKNYFFIIDGILCSVNVFRNKNTYRYDFVEESFAQGNRVIGSMHFKKKKYYYFAGGLAVIFLLLFLVPFFLTGSSSSGGQLLSKTGIPTTAQVIFVGTESADELKVYYSYHVNGEFVLSYFMAPSSGGTYYTPAGFPLETGDRFQVRYSKNNVRDHIFQIENPTTEQVEHYKEMVSNELLQKNSDLEVTRQQLTDYSNCVTEAIYNIYGISGLSAFYLNTNGLMKDSSRIKEYKSMLHNTTFTSEELGCRGEYLFSKKL